MHFRVQDNLMADLALKVSILYVTGVSVGPVKMYEVW
jgi:hypothetical protein